MKVGVGTPQALAFVSSLSLVASIFFVSSTLYNDRGAQDADFLVEEPGTPSNDTGSVLRADRGADVTDATSAMVTEDKKNEKRRSWAAANVLLSIALLGVASALVLINFENDLATHTSIFLPYYVSKSAGQAVVMGMRAETARSKFFARLAGLFAIIVMLWIVSIIWTNVNSLGFVDFATLVLMITFIVLFAVRLLGEQKKNFVLIALITVALWFGVLATVRIALALTKQGLKLGKNATLFLWGLLLMGVQLLFVKYILPFLTTQVKKIAEEVFKKST